MNSHMKRGCAALILGLVIAPSFAAAQPDTATAQMADPTFGQAPTPAPTLALGGHVSDETVIQYDLSGPRLGVTFAPDGTATSQFGWHFEHQAAPGTRGPWFIVERVFLVGGMEQNVFMPSGTLVFGLRLPNSFEFGVGPSATLGGREFFNTAIVIAAGQSFRAGGIRIPVNAAVAVARNGENRYTLVTGWAIRESFAH
jgi:hypothetical protein